MFNSELLLLLVGRPTGHISWPYKDLKGSPKNRTFIAKNNDNSLAQEINRAGIKSGPIKQVTLSSSLRLSFVLILDANSSLKQQCCRLPPQTRLTNNNDQFLGNHQLLD